MIVRNCSGGVVFCGGRVFLLKNDKDEWVLPKGAIRGGRTRREVALWRVKDEGGVEARILTAAGDTTYEFYSQTRRQPVCNRVHWYVMEADTARFTPNKEQGFTEGGYFRLEEALQRVTYTQDRQLVKKAYDIYVAETAY